MTSNNQHPANQLDRVICQIRFPALLEIDGMVAEFQKLIREDYPGYSQSSALPMNLANAPVPTDHIFQSNDMVWSITLLVASLSLTTTRYSDWKQFKRRLEQVTAAALDTFDIRTCNRVGLRYINAIRPSSVDLRDSSSTLRSPYSDLVKTDLGEFLGVNTTIDYRIDESVKGRSSVGTIQFMDGEEGVLIDDDTFVEEQIQIEELYPTLDRLNSYSLETFKKIASDDLISKVVS